MRTASRRKRSVRSMLSTLPTSSCLLRLHFYAFPISFCGKLIRTFLSGFPALLRYCMGGDVGAYRGWSSVKSSNGKRHLRMHICLLWRRQTNTLPIFPGEWDVRKHLVSEERWGMRARLDVFVEFVSHLSNHVRKQARYLLYLMFHRVATDLTT